jgi:predicted restriction endonuclease
MSSRSNDPLHAKWAAEIKNRDSYTCQICGQYGGYLESHHKYSYHSFPKLRYDIANGSCLCQICHEYFHRIFQRAGCTGWQFDQYVEIFETLKKIIISSSSLPKTEPKDK